MSRMFKGDGVPPTYETLAKITRTENVSLSWLLEGIGGRFIIRTFASVEQLLAEIGARVPLEELSALPELEISVLADVSRIVFVLHRSVQLRERRGAIEYQDVELLAGPAGPALAPYLQELVRTRHVQMRQLSESAMDVGLVEGWGSLELFGPNADGGDGALLQDWRSGSSTEQQVRQAATIRVLKANDTATTLNVREAANEQWLASLFRLQALHGLMSKEERITVEVMATVIADSVEGRRRR